jgi:hypothetical protein
MRIRPTLLIGLATLLVACLPSITFTSAEDASSDAAGTSDAMSPGVPDGTLADGREFPDASVTDAGAGDTGSSDTRASDTGSGDTGRGTPDAAADAPGTADGSAVSLDGLVLLLHMEEPSWSEGSMVHDSSPAGNSGVAHGTATTTPDGKFGRAGTFDGSGYVMVNDSPSLHATTALTYTAWIYSTGLDGSRYPGIVAKRSDYGVNNDFTMFIWVDNHLFGDTQGNLDRPESDAAIANGAWYHLAIVYDGTAAAASREKMYINGVWDSDHQADPSLTVGPAAIGIGFMPTYNQTDSGPVPDGNAFFIGRIDEVAIWTRALRPDEIAALYTATTPLQP